MYVCTEAAVDIYVRIYVCMYICPEAAIDMYTNEHSCIPINPHLKNKLQHRCDCRDQFVTSLHSESPADTRY